MSSDVDRLVDLIEAGVVTNKFKQVHPGRTVTSFINGTKRLFDFVHDNLAVEFHPCDRTNDTAVIRRNPRVVAINSATATASQKPSASTSATRLRPCTFLLASQPRGPRISPRQARQRHRPGKRDIYGPGQHLNV